MCKTRTIRAAVIYVLSICAGEIMCSMLKMKYEGDLLLVGICFVVSSEIISYRQRRRNASLFERAKMRGQWVGTFGSRAVDYYERSLDDADSFSPKTD